MSEPIDDFIPHPSVVNDWVVTVAKANTRLMEIIGGRFYKRGKVKVNEKTGSPTFPYVIYDPGPGTSNLMHRNRPMNKVVTVTIAAVMREDALPNGWELEQYLSPPTKDAGLVGEISRTFLGTKSPAVRTGNVWGARYLTDHKQEYQQGNLDVLEMGIVIICEATR